MFNHSPSSTSNQRPSAVRRTNQARGARKSRRDTRDDVQLDRKKAFEDILHQLDQHELSDPALGNVIDFFQIGATTAQNIRVLGRVLALASHRLQESGQFSANGKYSYSHKKRDIREQRRVNRGTIPFKIKSAEVSLERFETVVRTLGQALIRGPQTSAQFIKTINLILDSRMDLPESLETNLCAALISSTGVLGCTEHLGKQAEKLCERVFKRIHALGKGTKFLEAVSETAASMVRASSHRNPAAANAFAEKLGILYPADERAA